MKIPSFATIKVSDELNRQLNHHFSIINRCTAPTETYGDLLLASPPDKRYPFVYPRDASCAVQLLRRVAGSRAGYDAAPDAFRLMQGMAAFIRDAQSPQGTWGQRYDLDGRDKSLYKQEDNLAHGMAIICNYLLTARHLKKEVPDLDGYLRALNNALAFSLSHYYQKELNLFRSTTSIHESAMEEGYTVWVNFAFLYAFRLAEEVVNSFDESGIISRQHLKYCKHFSYSVGELFMSGNRYIRRIDPRGGMDMRPDFTLLSPFYFGFVNYPQELERSVRFLEKQLCDPELGLIMRYLPFYDDFSIHVHAGNGPWLQYSAILAQYHYWRGDTGRGDALLHKISGYASESGEIPEHLSTCRRFETFMENEWRSGLDYQKEFHPPILLDSVRFDQILEETNLMAESYRETGTRCMVPDGGSSEGGYIRFAAPLMWSHVEFAKALMIRAGDWWKIQKN